MLIPGSFALTLLLAMLTGLGPLSVDMYLASLPSIGRLLDAPTSQVQLTISAYLVGFAIAQIFHGPLSDRHGRRPVLLAALGIYLIATLACALSFSIETLIAARFVQAVGGSGASVLARAVVRDMYEGQRIGRELARMAAIMALAPLVAPLIGSVLETAFGWRSNFVALLCFGAIAWVMVWLLLPETLRQRAPEPVSIGSTLRSYRRFLADKGFVIHLGIATCCLSGLFAWISSGAFVLQDIFGLSPLAFGLSFTVAASGYLLGTLIAARFVMRWGGGRTMGMGTAAMALGGLVMTVLLAFTASGAIGVVGGAGLYLVGMGMTLAQAQAGALLPYPDRAGAASSLLGFVTQTSSAIVGAILGHALGETAWPLAIAMLLAGGLSLLLWTFSRGARARI
ncbi:MAG: transporter, family, multidrug resistance protein [Alphaproteobacteria bacterium]|jgi:DHA1 family bicyclomycin/chloramphenicol resistance-like MFS transporter|nr:transporter, family, multidrug resistance protein [Alphaproteobacteria bacterium]